MAKGSKAPFDGYSCLRDSCWAKFACGSTLTVFPEELSAEMVAGFCRNSKRPFGWIVYALQLLVTI